MKTFVAPTDEIAAALHRGELSEIEIAMPKPPLGCVYLMNGAGDKACCYAPERDLGNFTGPCWVPPTPTSKDHLLPCPYAPGDTIAVKERWRVASLHGSGWDIQYHSDLRYRWIQDYEPSYKPAGEWCCASKMATRWSDTRLLVLANDCREREGEWRWIVTVRKENVS
jgi:hypothetical protein